MSGYLTFGGSYTNNGTYYDSFGDTYVGTVSGTSSGLQVDRFGNTTGSVYTTYSGSLVASGPRFPTPVTYPISGSETEYLGGSIEYEIGRTYRSLGGSVNVSYSFTQSGSLVTLVVSGSAIVSDYPVAAGVTISGSETAYGTYYATTTNRAPTAASNNVGLGVGSTVSAQSIVTVADPDGDGLIRYKFWDSAGGGYFSLNGVRQAEATYVTVSDLSALSYTAGSVAGGDRIWFSVYDGLAWSQEINWVQRANRLTNVLPTVSAPNRNIASGQWIKASDLGIVVTDGDGDSPTQYQITDGNANAGSTQLWYRGSHLAQGGTLTVSAGELGNVWVQGGANNGTDTFSVRAHDGFGWSDAASFNLITRAPNRAPSIAGAGLGVAINTGVAATSLITVNDPDGDSPTLYRFWDAAGGGSFSLNGQVQAAGQAIDVSDANIANLSYLGGNRAGSEVLWAQVYDGQAWSAWASWNQQTTRASNVLPTVSAPNRNIASGQWIKASDLGLVVTDGDGDSPTQYQITDGNANTGSTQLWHGGSHLAQGGTLTVNAGDLGNVWVQGGANNGTDTFHVRAHDGFGWSDAASFNLVTRAPNRAPVVTTQNQSISIGDETDPRDFFSVSDADDDAPTIYRFWDAVAGGGYFAINGVQQAAMRNIDVQAGNISTLRFHAGDDIGEPEVIWVQVYDGTAWSEWRTFTITTTIPVPGQFVFGDEFHNVYTNAENAIYFSSRGPDKLVVDEPNSYQWLVGGDGRDTYVVTERARGSLTVVLDNVDRENPSALNHGLVIFELSSMPFGRMAAAWIDDRHLLIADLALDRYIVYVNYKRGETQIEMRRDEGENGHPFYGLYSIDSRIVPRDPDGELVENFWEVTPDYWFDSYFVLDFTSEDFGFEPGLFDSGLEKLQLASSFNESFGDFTRSIGERIAWRTDSPFQLLERVTTPGTYAPGGYHRWAEFGREGNDSLGSWWGSSSGHYAAWGHGNYTTTSATNVALLGGAGMDTYSVGAPAVIIERGAGGDDTLQLWRTPSGSQRPRFDSADTAIIDGRHLWIRDPIAPVLLVDWEHSANRIEFFTEYYLNQFNSVSSRTYTWSEVATRIAAANVPHYGWSDLAVSAADWNAQIARLSSREDALAANRAPTVVGLTSTLQAGASVSVADLISATDLDGDGIEKFWVSFGGQYGRGTMVLRGQPAGWSVFVDNASLSELEVIPWNHPNNIHSLEVRAFDGLDWGPLTRVEYVTVGGLNNAPEFAAGSGQPLIFSNPSVDSLPVASAWNLGTWIDRDDDAIIAIEIRDLDLSPESARISMGRSGESLASVVVGAGGANLADLWVHRNQGIPTADVFSVRAYDGIDWSPWADAIVAHLPEDPGAGGHLFVGGSPVILVDQMTPGSSRMFSNWVGRLDSHDFYALESWNVASTATARLTISEVSGPLSVTARYYDSGYRDWASGQVESGGSFSLDLSLPSPGNFAPWLDVAWAGPDNASLTAGTNYRMELALLP
ncbi:MAG: hypothetical protein JNM79_13990 [Burkholderiales bacterium]|nr:hypothetical protein [Burkholderiales bacterium]